MAAGQLQLDRLGAGRHPPAHGAGDFLAQCLHDALAATVLRP